MAKLGDITIKTAEYRPCYVSGRKALFHRWEAFPYVSPSKYMAKRWEGLNEDEAIEKSIDLGTLAIVEYEDGTIAKVYPEEVRFVPGLMNEYDFREAVMNETRNDADPGE